MGVGMGQEMREERGRECRRNAGGGRRKIERCKEKVEGGKEHGDGRRETEKQD